MGYYPPKSVSDERNYYEMYQIYRTCAQSCGVIRIGSGVYGAPYDYREAVGDASSGRRGESVAEHAYLSAVKLCALYDRFPKYWPQDRHGDRDAFAFLLQVHLLFFHDLAENELGDMPDDGSYDKSEKISAEELFMKHFAQHLSAPLGKTLMRRFTTFNETIGDSAIPRITEKSEALSRTAIYEANGSVGRLSYKASHYSPASLEDRKVALITGSDRQLDIWTYKFVQQFRGKPSFRELFGEVLVGTMVARNGEVFPWCSNDLLRDYDLKKLRRIIDGSEEE